MTQDNPAVLNKTRRAIRSAFLQLYKTNPITKITVRSIIERADCSRSSFYIYYQDVYALLDEIEDEMLRGMYTADEDWLSYSTDALRPADLPVFEFVRENKDAFQVLMGKYGRGSFQKKMVDTIRRDISRVTALFSKDDEMSIDFFTCVSFAIMEFYLAHIDEITPEAMAKMTIRNGRQLITDSE